MSRDMRFRESPATPEEDSYKYRIEWDDSISSVDEIVTTGEIKHFGSGSQDVSGYDNAWDVYNRCKKNTSLIGVRLVRIDADGNRTIM